VLDWAEPDTWRPFMFLETAADTVGRLRERFRALRSFHAARPLDVTPYYRRGIAPLTREQWFALVDECFLSGAKDAALVAAVRHARDVQFDLIGDGRVHFCCDPHLLEQRDGYHLLFGSLSLLAVAIQIDKAFGTEFKDALRLRGNPVVFVCDIPLALIEDEMLADLVAELRKAINGTAPLGFHFSIPRALPASCITSHYAPGVVIDAVYGRHIGMAPTS